MLAHTTYAAHSITGPYSSQHLAPKTPSPTTLLTCLAPTLHSHPLPRRLSPSPHFLYCCSLTAMLLPDLGLHSSLSPASQLPGHSHPTQTGPGSSSPMSQRWPPVKAPSWMGMDQRNPGHTAGQQPSHHILLVPTRVLPPALSPQHSPDPDHLLLTHQAAPYPTLPGSRRDSERTTA